METQEWILLCGVSSVTTLIFGHWLGWCGRGEVEKNIRLKEQELKLLKVKQEIEKQNAKQEACKQRTQDWDCEHVQARKGCSRCGHTY